VFGEVKVVSNKKLTGDIYLMRLLSPEITKEAKPGQFVHIRCGEGKDYILRRPLSIHRVYDEFFELLYKVVGHGTMDLSRLEAGKTVDLIGPLGNGFNLAKVPRQVLIVAGGVGIAPLMFLIDELRERKITLSAVLGTSLRKELLYHDELSRTVENTFVSVDEDSAGNVGSIIDILPEVMNYAKPKVVYACGPEEMLKNTVTLCFERDLACHVSLERQMGCGVGVCMACVVKTNAGYQRVCKDGPVFDAREIVWE
jgi:dihydroorotate dehydrogenase electron transfer subunit